MAAAMYTFSPFTTKKLFSLNNDLGINKEFMWRARITMESEKYICVRETNSVVIIDMTKPKQTLRLPITADSAIMNPDSPILAFKVEAKIGGTTKDQLQIYDIEARTTSKSYNIAEKVEYWKWISPKLLVLVTLKAIYHWSIEDLTGPRKMYDMTDQLATHKKANILDYMNDASGKWLAIIGEWKDRELNNTFLFIRPIQGGDQWLSFCAHAAAFTTFNVEGNSAPSTLLCSAIWLIKKNGFKYDKIDLTVQTLLAQPGEPGSAKNLAEFSIDAAQCPVALQISEKYGLVYIITRQGLMSIHDLETAETVCSFNVIDYKTTDDLIFRTREGRSNGSFYAINKKGQVLHIEVNNLAINKLLFTRAKLRHLQKLGRQVSNENQGLKKQNAELQNVSAKIKKGLEESLQLETKIRRETEEQLNKMRTELDSYQQSQQGMVVEIEGLKTHNIELQIEIHKIETNLDNSIQNEIGIRQETKEQLSRMTREINSFQESNKKILNEIEELKTQNANLQDERDKIGTQLEESLQLETKLRREIEEQLINKITELSDSKILQEQLHNEIEGLKKQNTELAKENKKIIEETTESIQLQTKVWSEIEKRLESKMIDLDRCQKLQQEMLKEIEGLTKQNTELSKEKVKITADMAKSLQEETKIRREIEEELKSKMIELNNYQISQQDMQNEIERLKNQNIELINEREKTIKNLEELRSQIEGFASSSNHLVASFTEFTHAELQQITNDFNDALKIGEGGYGPVYKAFLGLTPVAIKILKNESQFGNREFYQEVETLRKLRHQNLVMLLGACWESHALVYEFMPNGNLYDILRNKQTPYALSAKSRIHIASDICSALIFLHMAKPHGIVHGDLKSTNILLDSNYMGKLSDFGVSRQLEKTDSRNTAYYFTNNLKGTRPYMDPEYVRLGEMTVQCDVYSFGIVLLELVTGRDPMGLRDQVEDAFENGEIFVDDYTGNWPLEEAKKMVQLGLKCSEFSRRKRPNLEKEVWTEIESMLHASLHF